MSAAATAATARRGAGHRRDRRGGRHHRRASPCWPASPASAAGWSSPTPSAPPASARSTRPPTPSPTSCSRSRPAACWPPSRCRSSPGSWAAATRTRGRPDRLGAAHLGACVLVPLGAAAGPARRADQPSCCSAHGAVRRGAASSAPTCCASSPRRCCSTASASCWPACCRPTAGSSRPALAPLLSSLVVIGAYLAYGALAQRPRATTSPRCRPGADLALAVGTTLGVVVLSLPLLVPVRGPGVRLRPDLRFPRRRRPGGSAALAAAGWSRCVAQQVAVLVTSGSPTTAAATAPSTSTSTSRPSTCCRMPCSPCRSRPRPSRRWRPGTSPAGARGADAAHGSAGVRRRPAPPPRRAPTAGAWLRPCGTRPSAPGRCALAMGLGAGVLVAVAVPVGAFFAALDAGRTASAVPTPSPRCPRAWWRSPRAGRLRR